MWKILGKYLALLIGYGLLPLWLSTLAVIAGSMMPNASSQYWAVAPWLIVASTELCKYTLAIAVVTTACRSLMEKKSAAVWMFAILNAVALAYGGYIYTRLQGEKKADERARQQALEFAKHHPKVIEFVGADVEARSSRSMLLKGSRRTGAIGFYVEKPKEIRGVVQIGGTLELPTFRLTCLTTEKSSFDLDSCPGNMLVGGP